MVAGAFKIDPAVVWSGSELDVAMRMAAATRLAVLIEESKGG